MNIQAGYQKASSQNLPKVDLEMLSDFIHQNESLTTEKRCVKAAKSARANYGDYAVEWVQVRRDAPKCAVKARICPEHKLRQKSYSVSAIIDEIMDEIGSAECYDCPASAGGCKHAIALVAWLYRRSCEPSPTSVECYWKKSALSGIGSKIKSMKIGDMAKKQSQEQEDNLINDEREGNLNGQLRPAELRKQAASGNDREFLEAVMKRSLEENCENHFTKFYRKSTPVQETSMHYLSTTYVGDRHNVDDFLTHCQRSYTLHDCQVVEASTKNQSEAAEWHELRYGRITASTIYDVSRCQTMEGSLLEKIMGGRVLSTAAMERGKRLESEVIDLVQKQLGVRIKTSGLLLSPQYPPFGASPDGVSDNFVFEVKCPSKMKTVEYYCNNRQINQKCRARMQLQMLFADKKEAIFCIADPNFETTKIVCTAKEVYDDEFVDLILRKSLDFWRLAVFPKIMKAGEC